MAGYTIEKAKQIAQDLSSSWYFRFWALFWLISALVSFSALIILSEQAKTAQNQEDIQTWFENASSINFPRFHFRMDHHSNEVFSNMQCTFQGAILQNQPCSNWFNFTPPQNQCQAIWADGLSSPNDWAKQDNRIFCSILTFGAGTDGNLEMAFELEGRGVFSMTGEAFSSVWFAPNNNAWIMLEKSILTDKRHTGIQLWQNTLLYHSTLFQPNFYNVTVIMGSHFVRHFEPKDNYNGWMTVADIGGVGFFMVVIHGLAMIIFGLFFTNNSSFLGAQQ